MSDKSTIDELIQRCAAMPTVDPTLRLLEICERLNGKVEELEYKVDYLERKGNIDGISGLGGYL